MAFLLNSYLLQAGGTTTGAAAGVGAAAAVGIRLMAAIGTAAGTGNLSAVSGEYGYESVAGSAGGTGAGSGAGISTAESVGTAAGTGQGSAVSLEPVGTAAGSGAASAAGSGLVASVGSAAGNSTGTVAVPDLNEYIVFDAHSNGGSAATGGVETWTHTPAGNPKGIVVFAESSQIAASPYLVLYGDRVMTPVAMSRKSTGENSVITAFFLGTDVPTGPQQVSMYSRGTYLVGQALSYVSDIDADIINTVSLSSDAITNPSATLELFGQEAAVAMAGMGGSNNQLLLDDLPNWTRVDFETTASLSFIASRYDLYDTSDVTVGWDQDADDANLVAVAIARAASGMDSPFAWVNSFSQGPTANTTQTWTHTPVGDSKGVLIFVVQPVSGTDLTLGVTYGGVDVREISGSPLLKPAAEAMGISTFFLSNPPQGAQTVVVNLSGSGSKMCYCYTIGSDDEIGIGNTVTISSNSVADPNTTLALSTDSLVLSAYATGATSGFSPLDEAIDINNTTASTAFAGTHLYRYIYNTDMNVGLQQGTDDIVLVAVAIQRAPKSAGTGAATAISEITYAGAGTATGSGGAVASGATLGLAVTSGSAPATGSATAAGQRVVNSVGSTSGISGTPEARSSVTAGFDFTDTDFSTANQSVYEFTVNIGAADPDRVILMTLTGGYPTALTINSILINGVSAGVRAFANSGTGVSFAAIASAKVPTGTSVDVTVTLSGVSNRLEIAVYRALDIPVLPLDTVTASIAFNSASVSLSDIQVVPNGVFVGVAYGNYSADLVATYNGVDDLITDHISDVESIGHRAAYLSGFATEDNATRDITLTWSDSGSARMAAAAASWGRIVSGSGTATGSGAAPGEGWYLQAGRKRVLEDGTSARLLEDGTSYRLME